MYALPCTSEVVPVVSDSLYTWWSIVVFIIRLITSINALHAFDTVGDMPHEVFQRLQAIHGSIRILSCEPIQVISSTVPENTSNTTYWSHRSSCLWWFIFVPSSSVFWTGLSFTIPVSILEPLSL